MYGMQYVSPTNAVVYGSLAGLTALSFIGHPIMTLAGIALGIGAYIVMTIFR